MSYSAEIPIENPKLLKLLEIEYSKTENRRFEVFVGKKVAITAKDASSFKAVLNSIANTIVIFEKTGRI